ncbi:hypothetical protein [Pseudaminobacter soli (ex Li et al. 2025)]|uniref:Uncharacterized protein n=1 Tax=Pseudaminobacter soli (ex Li et al. 2025) TaxID=1295366 RepID=A0A2P7SEM4_9HYPH|nr:hypothetical protein [Mesorhizobium soli]PSJ60761.1 hypothetical protein C7I85_12015 [Mesorhizobium soli]
MSPEVKAQYKADLARVRAERDRFREWASQKRKDYIGLKKKRRFLDALHALDRYQEYRNSAAQFDSEAKRIQEYLK